MNIEFTATKPKDLKVLNTNSMGELLWWSYQLGISVEKILAITQEVGNNAEEVKKLAKHHD